MFTGRKPMLEKLARFLDPSKPSMVLKRQRIFVLYGLGGAGKTQIMIKFVIEFGDQYDHSVKCLVVHVG
jgi:flagellar biosynthesis GTPase FlhF